MNLKNKFLLFGLTIFILIVSCKNTSETEDLSFKLIPRNSYFLDNYNGISIYRDNETRKPMDGYYVVGNTDVKWEEFKVKNGVLNGDYIVFHNNGNMYAHAKYLNGKLHGEEKTYNISGTLSKASNYNHGARFGKDISYFENGQIRSESKIKNEEVIESISYNIIGEIESQMFIKDGRKITQEIKGGKVFIEEISSTYDDFEAMKFYNEDGSFKVFLRMIDQGDKSYLIELDENENEIKRIDVKANPQEAMKYFEYLEKF